MLPFGAGGGEHTNLKSSVGFVRREQSETKLDDTLPPRSIQLSTSQDSLILTKSTDYLANGHNNIDVDKSYTTSGITPLGAFELGGISKLKDNVLGRLNKLLDLPLDPPRPISEMENRELRTKNVKLEQLVKESKEHVAVLQNELVEIRAENEQLRVQVGLHGSVRVEELQCRISDQQGQIMAINRENSNLLEKVNNLTRAAQEQADMIKTLQSTLAWQVKSMEDLQKENATLKDNTKQAKYDYSWEREKQEVLNKVHKLEGEIEMMRSETKKVGNAKNDEVELLAHREERERLDMDITSVVNYLAESHKLVSQLQCHVSAANWTIKKWHEFGSYKIGERSLLGDRNQKSTVVTVPVFGRGYDDVDKVLAVLNDTGEQFDPPIVFYHDVNLNTHTRDATNELAVLLVQNNEKDKDLETRLGELGYVRVLKLRGDNTNDILNESGAFPVEISEQNIGITQQTLEQLFAAIGNSIPS